MEIVWLLVVGLLLAGWYALDGFALGAGMFLAALRGDARSRRHVVAAVGPFFLANEVWLIAFAGVLAVTFPDAEAALFTALYPVIVLMVAAWLVRDLGMWFRARRPEPGWQRWWETTQAVASLVFAAAAGLFLGNAVQEPGDGVLRMLNPYGLLGALTTVALFALHGTAFLALRTTGELRERARRAGGRLAPAALGLLVLLVATAPLASATGLAPLALVPGLAGPAGVTVAWRAMRKGRDGTAFAGTVLAAACLPLTAGALMAGRLLDGVAGESTIDRLTMVALPILPFLLAAQAVLWWVHRHRLNDRSVTFF
ncbi:cytochrome d ubiquinol oxidase subunit II [Nonomuraea gerenzanensis]|uniref:Cytochrome d ubiquinol oxidase subunit II n=1 Tax=Nonomuraea gerenzanensis TaxID=93944 RepID=A0A1M4DXC6_9ACTN|nr:cytochrome d ubiquinol oxidase subunit II [Nonomuraea gerenzanensis]UBU13558.1 cytochrome d ubiquinol oxidase subunit II [Nonomuraea gerenzanensis]SBO91223.1 Cytochrome d ubiquinol oxidase subunit II [Nonomuraea gerenzanensis]